MPYLSRENPNYGNDVFSGMEESLETVEVSYDEDTGVGRLALDRPDNLNAISPQLDEDIRSGLDTFRDINSEADGVDVSAVVVEGRGDAFCSGADLMSFADAERPFTPRPGLWRAVREFELPVIAKVHGYCLGGGFELALACDLRVAHEDAVFGFPEIDLGLLPGAGGVHYVARIAGEATARELAYTGEKVSAERADDLGVVDHVYPADEFDDEAMGYVEEVAGKAPLALQGLKESINMSMDVPLDRALEHDKRAFMQLLETEDFNQGMMHFGQDSTPEFEGK